MKKLLTLTAVGVILTAPAIATSKCVPMWGVPVVFTGNWSGGGAKSKTDFQIIYSHGSSDSFTMYGTSYCSSATVQTVGTNIIDDLDATSGGNCWCRFMSPAVTKWVHATTYTDNATCTASCANQCASWMRSSSILQTMGTNAINIWLGY